MSSLTTETPAADVAAKTAGAPGFDASLSAEADALAARAAAAAAPAAPVVAPPEAPAAPGGALPSPGAAVPSADDGGPYTVETAEAEWAGALVVILDGLTPIFPSLEKVYTEDRIGKLAHSWAVVCVKRGVKVSAVLDKWLPEAFALWTTWGVVLPTWRAIKEDLEAAKREAEAAAARASAAAAAGDAQA